MQHTLTRWSAALLLSALTCTTGAMAATVTPSSYTFDQPTACGTWCYHDASLTKLTDGVVGTAGWAANAGSEWAGWSGQAVVNIDFSFAAVSSIASVSIGSTQDSLADVALPSFAVYAYESGAWALKGTLINPPSDANNVNAYSTAPHSFYTLSGLGIVSDKVRVAVSANGPWSFVDEVRFDGAGVAPVPEPDTYALLMAGLGVVGLVARRRLNA